MPSSFRVRKLDPSTALLTSDPGSLPEIGDIETVLSKAFTGDLFTAVVTAHDPKGTETSHIGPFWVSTIVAGLIGGEVYVAETDDAQRKIVGCAVWFGPGHSMYDTQEQQKYVLGPLMASFSEELQHWWSGAFLPQYDSFLTSTLGAGTKHNSWHLQTLAVDPQYQRQGAATALVNSVAEKARPTGGMLCVETAVETYVEVFTKMGFERMPKGKDLHACKDTFAGIKNDSFPLWVLV
ncbi:hypothetical protein B0H13DRAFT_1719531, partial [Mycena leptocephala]